MIARCSACLPFLVLAGCASAGGDVSEVSAEPAWLTELATWRAEREERLTSPSGYLAIAGLWWLEEGETRIGGGDDNEIVLPAPAPEHVGVLDRDGDVVTFDAAPGVEVTASGEPVSTLRLEHDADGAPTRVEVGELTWWVIRRGERLGIRLRDPRSPVLASYRGTRTYPPDERWIVDAVFTPFEEPTDVAVPNILGSTYRDEVAGVLAFELDGRPLELLCPGDAREGGGVVFGDETNGDGTYGGGRVLPVSAPGGGGAVRLDFNRAYNLPCAYSPYTTCPLPLPENRLPLRVEAGEKVYRTD